MRTKMKIRPRSKALFSIKTRVTVWFAVIMFLIATVVFYVMIVHRTSQVKADAERSLVTSVAGLAGMVKRTGDFSKFDNPRANGDNPSQGAAPSQDGNARAHNTPPDGFPDNSGTEPGILHAPSPGDKKPRTYAGGVHMAVFSEEGEILLGQIPFEFDEIDFKEDEVRTLTSNSERYFTTDKKVTTPSGSVWVKGVINISGALNAVNSTVAADYMLITVLILIAAIGGYFIVGRALAPIAKMRKTAREIADSSDLSRRIRLGAGKDEVYRLAAVFDEMLDKLQNAFEAEKQFTSDASHELRTPVAVILSECEYALDCANSSEEFCDSLAVIKRQGDKMSKLISALLTISRMDKSSLVPELEETNLSELLEIVCDEQKELWQTDTTFLLDIAPNIIAKADSALIARLFINLISNACQYGKQNGTVTVSLKQDGANAAFSVTDDGLGIAEEELPKIWERFYQVNKSRNNKNGSMGLGLSMVKQIANLHRGSVTATSVQGKGSTFTFIMPLGI